MVDFDTLMVIILLLVVHLQLPTIKGGPVIMAPNMSVRTCKCINAIREFNPEVRECVEDSGYLVRPSEVDLLGACLPPADRERLKNMDKLPVMSAKSCRCINAIRDMNPESELNECIDDSGYNIPPADVKLLSPCLSAVDREKYTSMSGESK